MAKFIHLGGVINKKQDKRVLSVTVAPTVTDCSGTIWFTDLMLQEGSVLTGYEPCTKDGILANWSGDAENKSIVWYNGIVRGETTLIVANLGKLSAGLDLHLYPKNAQEKGSVQLSCGVGGHKVSFPNAMEKDDDVALLATARECTKNGEAFPKRGFYQYAAAWDSKHKVTLEEKTSARVLYTMQQMEDGGVKF